MPIYTYKCDNCDKEFEAIKSIANNETTYCSCSNLANRVYKYGTCLIKGKDFYQAKKVR